jgi:hypothetical protein
MTGLENVNEFLAAPEAATNLILAVFRQFFAGSIGNCQVSGKKWLPFFSMLWPPLLIPCSVSNVEAILAVSRVPGG